MQLINDESSECKTMIAATIKKLISSIDIKQKKTFLALTLEWFKDDQKPPLQKAAVQVFSMIFSINLSKSKISLIFFFSFIFLVDRNHV
jgi:hypothetical protein